MRIGGLADTLALAANKYATVMVVIESTQSARVLNCCFVCSFLFRLV